MLLRKKIRTALSILMVVFVLVQTGACGFILYPERKGRTSGRIDPGVAILDAILLIPGILPGVIAFAVDFVTGCIYLPGGKYYTADMEALSDGQNPQRLALAADQLDIPSLERMLSDQAGHPVQLDKDKIQVLRVNDVDFIRNHFILIPNPGT